MPDDSFPAPLPDIGLIGFGAFGRLIAAHLSPYFRLCAYDPAPGLEACAKRLGVRLVGLDAAARRPVVIIAAPVGRMQEIAAAIAPTLRPGALVLDVGSVKVLPAAILERTLPRHVDILATHPLFGPQSARNGVRGLKIALCPVRGSSAGRVAAFLRKVLGLEVILTTPEAHDREAATVQGLTHLIAKVLVRMEPLPTRMTTKSFDLLMEAVSMVRDDSPEVYAAIERDNPFTAGVRDRFFAIAAHLDRAIAPCERNEADDSRKTRRAAG